MQLVDPSGILLAPLFVEEILRSLEVLITGAVDAFPERAD